MHWPLGNSQLPPAKSPVSAPAGERDTSQGGSSVASTIDGQNSTPSSSPNNSGVADITQWVTSTPPRGLETCLPPGPIQKPTRSLQIHCETQATERHQRQRQWQLQPEAVSTPRSTASGSCSIHRFGLSDIKCLVVAMRRLMELYTWNRRPCMSAYDLETIRDVM